MNHYDGLADAGVPLQRDSISPNSMRKPRTFTWWSSRPRKSIRPSGRWRARVARPVHAASRLAREWIGQEALCRLLMIIKIAV